MKRSIIIKRKFNYIYGPVASWRLGVSLGVDLLSTQKKVCNFDCLYCQVGRTQRYFTRRKVYAPTDKVIAELKRLPAIKIDYITFSGIGEPTLAKNLGQVIKAIKKLRKEPVAVLTNAALMHKKEVREELGLADFVIAKLDAYSEESLRKVNKPGPGIKFKTILKALKSFRKEYSKRLGLQIMFISQNKNRAMELARLCKEIRPDEVQINTPLRQSEVKPLAKGRVLKIAQCFTGFCAVSVYGVKRGRRVRPLSPEHTQLRRSKNK